MLLADTAGGDEDAPEKTELEARLVAQRVRRLLDEGFPVTDKQTGELRPVTAGDIVILLRSPKGKARTYIAALERVGVTATAEQRGGLLETNEVGTIVSLLNVIDNPRQDVDLIGVMLSPLFGFSEEELAEIRLTDRTAGFYDALLLARETMPKAESFVQKLDYLRAFAVDQHLALRDAELGLAARGYQICELQQGVKLDKFGFDLDFSHLHATSQAGPDR